LKNPRAVFDVAGRVALVFRRGGRVSPREGVECRETREEKEEEVTF